MECVGIGGVRTDLAPAVERLATLLSRASRPVVFTGAGVSTESGIPDFRSPGGLWDRFDAAELTYQSFVGSVEGRRRYWAMGRAVYPVIRSARPNAAHHAIAELHRLDRLDCCITQNVDDLHRRAGLPADKVIELHGNATRARCLGCAAPYTRDEVHAWLEQGADVAECPACGGIVKPWTVLFGEAMPVHETREAERRARASDLFVVVGSSLAVYPAAYMPMHARDAGAILVIVNRVPTPRDGHADLVIHGPAGAILSETVARVKGQS